MGAKEETESVDTLRSQLWTSPTVVFLLAFFFLFLLPRCNWAWGIDPRPSGG